MKILILMTTLICAMTACAAEPVNTATGEQNLICGDDCDPGNFQALASNVLGGAAGLGQQVTAMTCRNNYATESRECFAIFEDPWTQRYLEDCGYVAAYGTSCSTLPCGQPDQPDC